GGVPLVGPARLQARPVGGAGGGQRLRHCRQPFPAVGVRPPAREQRPAYAARLARLRSLSVSSFLRRRISLGVISTSSSSSMKSSACSSENLVAGVSWIASSLPEARMLVSGLVLIAFTVRSLSFEWMPTSWPSYTWSPSAANSLPRSCSGPSE